MELTQEQYELIASHLPVQRGNVKISNLQALNAILYVAEQGCKWRGLPERFGRWHTVYMRMNRWSKSGVLERVFEQLREEGIVKAEMSVVSLDSTTVKVHPDGTGALKKRSAVDRQVSRRSDDEDTHGRRRRANACDILIVFRTGARCAGRSQVAESSGSAAG